MAAEATGGCDSRLSYTPNLGASLAWAFAFQKTRPSPGPGSRAPDLVQLLLGHVRLPFGAQGPEGALNLLTGLDVLSLTADHEGHVFLQGDMAIPRAGGKV